MGILKQALAGSVAIAMVSSSALAAEAIRPSGSLAAAGTPIAMPVQAGMRVGGKVDQKNNLLGGPLFLAFLGAVVITITTIIIINSHNDNPKSP